MTYPPVPLRLETVRLVHTPQVEDDAGWFAELLNARGTGVFSEADALEKIRSMALTIASTGIGSLQRGSACRRSTRPTGWRNGSRCSATRPAPGRW